MEEFAPTHLTPYDRAFILEHLDSFSPLLSLKELFDLAESI
jgi:hypothetical protein